MTNFHAKVVGGILMHLPALSVRRVGVLLAGVAVVAGALCLGKETGARQRAAQPSAGTGRETTPVEATARAPVDRSRGGRVKDIRLLNQHFNEPGADTTPWMFVPKENIKELSTSEHPGLVTLWEAGQGRDI